MSADSPAVSASVGRWRVDLRGLQILRYALGSTIAMALAMGVNWQLSFLAPVLSLNFLATPTPRPTLRQGLAFILTIAMACLAGLLLGKYLLAYPLVYVPFTGLLLFRLFYYMASGRSPLLTTWLLIAFLVIPLIMITSPAIAKLVALGILTGAAVTMGVVWLTYGLLPDPLEASAGESPPPAAAKPPAPAETEKLKTAAISTLVVLPILTVFYSLKMQDAILILVFVALLSAQPGFASNFKAGGALILGNAFGGAAAILVYNLLVMVSEFGFLILLIFLAGLVFGARVFGGKPSAKFFGMAFSTLLLVIGSTTASGTAEAGAEVYIRVAQITVAVVYAVMAFGVADRFIRRKGA